MKKIFSVCCLAMLMMTHTVLAYAETQRDHGSHVHGTGELNIALEGAELGFQLIVPAFDIVGFGHQAKSTQDLDILKQAKAKLNDSANMIILPKAAQCKIEEVDVVQEWEGHKEHEPKAPKARSGHATFSMTYSYTCKAPQHLNQATLNYFSHFPNAKSLKGRFVSSTGQKAMTLTPDTPKVMF